MRWKDGEVGMSDREKVIKGLEQFKSDFKPFCGNSADWKRVDDALALLKEQQRRIEALEIDRDILVKDINTNNCNTCKRKCEHRPELGGIVRVNCFMWEGR